MDDKRLSESEPNAGVLALAHKLLLTNLPLEGKAWEENWESVYEELFVERNFQDMLALAWKLADPDWYEELLDYEGHELPDDFYECSIHALRGVILTRDTSYLPDILCLLEAVFSDFNLADEWELMALVYGEEAVPYLAAFSRNEYVSGFVRAESLDALAHAVDSLPYTDTTREEVVTFLRDFLEDAYRNALDNHNPAQLPNDEQRLLITYAANAIWSLDGEDSQVWIDRCREQNLIDESYLYQPLHGYEESEEVADEDIDSSEEEGRELSEETKSFHPWIEIYAEKHLENSLENREACLLYIFAEVCGEDIGIPIESVDVDRVKMVLFEAYVQEAPLLPGDADLTIESLARFWTLIRDRIDHRYASKIVDFLNKQSTLLRFERALGNYRKWSPAKLMLLTSRTMGFDLSDEEGVAAFTNALTQAANGEGDWEFSDMFDKSDDEKPRTVENRVAISMPSPPYTKEDRKKILQQKLNKNKKDR